MAGTVEFPKRRTVLGGETQRTWLTSVFALAASVAIMLVASPATTVSPVAHWVVSSIALTTALVVFVAALHAWGEMVSSAQAAGVVER
ncbi:hypothetical protein PDG61_25635 [Mycolicibacterium sp. BiH015]|uniref:hypothetical protein n=1 Tax=Mycolicibacterium sp. BiH015 TaxID=3018808 RepID=UPI0022E09960|nr:hypothetical protein [Mycolicibacterium sp. BiH015]MDA2894315.1 hypothetical protein [Mycolicibacterium sp. BiH015]